MDEIEYSKGFAKELIDAGNFEIAKQVLEKLWNESSKDDMYLLNMYGRALRKTNESDKFVEICRDRKRFKTYLSNKYIKSTLCWCIYDCYIKEFEYDPDNSEAFNDFIHRAEFIVDNCVQEDKDNCFINPYVLTIRKVIKVYKGRGTNYRAMLRWIQHLDPSKLPEDVFKYTDESGVERENASLKEFYYQNKSAALEKLGEYLECIECCEDAFSLIQKFHYKNHIWLKERLLYSKCLTTDSEEQAKKCLNEYKSFVAKYNYWYMYHKISQYYYVNNKIDDAMYYACKALTINFNAENMVKLILDLGFIFENKGYLREAEMFFHACAYYRERNGWIISEELKYKIVEYKIEVNIKPKTHELQKICINFLNEHDRCNRKTGKIKKIFSDKGFGFISYNNSEDIYFKIKNVTNLSTISIGKVVTFEIAEDFEGRKKAIKIKGVKQNG